MPRYLSQNQKLSNVDDTMKKLLYILNSYSKNEASHFPHVLNLLEMMASKGCEIVLLIEKADSLPSFQHSSIQAIGLTTRLPLVRHVELFFRVVSLIRKGYLATFIRIAAPAAIVASFAHHLFGGKAYLWQSGTTHEYDWAQPWSLKKIIWLFSTWVPNVIARNMAHHFVTGPEYMVDYYAEVVGVRREKIILLYNDVDISKFSFEDKEKQRNIFLPTHNKSNDSLVLLLVHRLSPVRKTCMYLEPLLRRLKTELSGKWLLVVAGGGSELGEAKKIVETMRLEDSVIFLGNVPNHKIAELYAVGDVFIHPTYTEGFPRVLIEAMAASLPIVTTDAGGTAQLLGNKQKQYVVSKSDPEAFAQKTISLLQDRGSWRELAEENYCEVRRFSTDAVADMYMREIL